MSGRKRMHQEGVQKNLHDYYGGQFNKGVENECGFDEEKACRAMAKLVSHVEDVSPESFVSHHFKEFIELVNPKFHVNVDGIERNCLDVYKEEKIVAKQQLENCDGQISLSLDVMRNDTYDLSAICFAMCLRAHFVDADWNLKNWVISYFEPYLGGKNPSTACMETFSDLNICDKISTLTLGKIDDNDTISEFIRNRIERKKHLKELIFHVHCCADTFRRMVECAFEDIEDNIYDVRLLVGSGKSPPAWHIIIDDLQRAVEMESKGEYTNTDEYYYQDIPSESEWKKIRVVAKLVGSIYDAAKPLFETKNPSASMYLQNIWELKLLLAKETTSSDQFMKVMALEMLKKLDEYWKDMSLFLAVVTVMDPRCKMNYIEFFSSKYKENCGNLQAAHVLETIEGLFKSYAASDLEAEKAGIESPMPDAEDSSVLEDDSYLPKAVKEQRSNPSFGFSCLDEYNKFVESKGQPPKSELELYLEAQLVPWEKDFDVLRWWKDANTKYPTLAKIARDLLAIPLTLANHGDAYYMEFRPPDAGLMTLKPEVRNALKCTRSWSKQP